MTILIIEDNEIEMENLKILLNQFDEYNVIATADNINEGIEIANSQEPDIIMLDIHLGCQNSLEHVHRLTYNPYIICSTLHTEHALQAFEVGVSDYLTKPITHKELCRALDRLREMKEQTDPNATQNRLPLNKGTTTHMVPIEHIILVTGDRDYTLVRDKNNAEFINTRRMREWSELLPTNLFVTLDRSTIVNKVQIVSFTRLGADRMATVSFANGYQHKIGSIARRRLKSISEAT